jgi:hypothetical protein
MTARYGPNPITLYFCEGFSKVQVEYGQSITSMAVIVDGHILTFFSHSSRRLGYDTTQPGNSSAPTLRYIDILYSTSSFVYYVLTVPSDVTICLDHTRLRSGAMGRCGVVMGGTLASGTVKLVASTLVTALLGAKVVLRILPMRKILCLLI